MAHWIRYLSAERGKSKEQEHKLCSVLVCTPNPSLKGTRGYALVFSPYSVRPRPLARALGTSKKEQGRVRRTGSLGTLSHGCSVRFAYFRFFGSSVGEAVSPHRPNPVHKGTRGYALACFPLVPPVHAPHSGVRLHIAIYNHQERKICLCLYAHSSLMVSP